jgi:hypothetical protein
MMQTLFNDILKAFIEWWKKVWFEPRLSARLKMIELENQVESELEREEAAKPIYTEHPVDPELQTGDSQKLGGAMQLTAPWYKDQDASSES